MEAMLDHASIVMLGQFSPPHTVANGEGRRLARVPDGQQQDMLSRSSYPPGPEPVNITDYELDLDRFDCDDVDYLQDIPEDFVAYNRENQVYR